MLKLGRQRVMAIGRRTPKQDEMFIPTAQVATGSVHPFHAKLNAVLAEAAFDEFVEKLCAPHYKEGGRLGAGFDVLLYDLTGTFFESDLPLCYQNRLLQPE
jgi:hypothetical protein